MFTIYQAIKTAIHTEHPDVQYTYWNQGQLDQENPQIIPPAVLINIHAEWMGLDATATIDIALWLLHYADAYTTNETIIEQAFQKANAILTTIDHVSGTHFNTPQRTQESIRHEYNGLVIQASYICNLRK